jgi:hypothetical protein
LAIIGLQQFLHHPGWHAAGLRRLLAYVGPIILNTYFLEEHAMRPLCGAIIAAGALIGLGLFSVGYGTRYSAYAQRTDQGHFDETYWIKLSQMDTPLIIVMVLLLASLLTGLAIAFVGLAYHHHKRQLELLQHKGEGHLRDVGAKM